MSVRTELAQAARRGVRVAARATDAVWRPRRGVVVLSYHQVGAPRAGRVNIDPAVFDTHMAVLASARDAGPVVDLDGALDRLDDDVATIAASDPVSVTFDDGTADFVEHALPVLVRHRVPVTLYLATGYVEEGRSFWDDGTTLSWAALADACSTGLVSIGSHTHTHALLDRADAGRVALELDRSCELIGERLGVEARHFAYPKARPLPRSADTAVRTRFASAAVAGGRPNPYGATDRWRLARTPVVADDTADDVARKARGGLRLEGALRDQLDRVRYRGRTG